MALRRSPNPFPHSRAKPTTTKSLTTVSLYMVLTDFQLKRSYQLSRKSVSVPFGIRKCFLTFNLNFLCCFLNPVLLILSTKDVKSTLFLLLGRSLFIWWFVMVDSHHLYQVLPLHSEFPQAILLRKQQWLRNCAHQVLLKRQLKHQLILHWKTTIQKPALSAWHTENLAGNHY